MTNTTHTPKTNFFNTKEDYIKFITHWKALANSKKATCEEHILYTILKGNDFNKAFTPVTNKTKIIHNLSGNKYGNIATAYHRVSYALTTIQGPLHLIIKSSWYTTLNDDTKEKLKFFFTNTTFKKIIGEE